MRHTSVASLAYLVVLLAVPSVAAAQASQQGGTLAIAGQAGQAPLVQINGRSYVAVDSLARLIQGSLSFQANQTILTLPGTALAQQAPPVNKGFSKDFLRAGIEEMTVIREWRVAIVNAVQNNSPVSEDWVSRYRLAANSKLSLAGAAATTDSDRNAFQLLTNEFNNMQQMSEHFVTLHNNVQYTSPDSFDNNPLDAKILGCAQALGAMAANNQFQDDPSCH